MRQPPDHSKRRRTRTNRYGAKKKRKQQSTPSETTENPPSLMVQNSLSAAQEKPENKSQPRIKQHAGFTIGDPGWFKKQLDKTKNSRSQRALTEKQPGKRQREDPGKQPENNDNEQKEKLRHLDGDSFSVITGYVTVLI